MRPRARALDTARELLTHPRRGPPLRVGRLRAVVGVGPERDGLILCGMAICVPGYVQKRRQRGRQREHKNRGQSATRRERQGDAPMRVCFVGAQVPFASPPSTLVAPLSSWSRGKLLLLLAWKVRACTPPPARPAPSHPRARSRTLYCRACVWHDTVYACVCARAYRALKPHRNCAPVVDRIASPQGRTKHLPGSAFHSLTLSLRPS